MHPAARWSLALVPSGLVPLAVVHYAREEVEGPYGTAFEILGVMVLGAALALVLLAVGFLVRRRRGAAAPWFAGAGVAVSPIAYYLLWNLFVRTPPF